MYNITNVFKPAFVLASWAALLTVSCEVGAFSQESRLSAAVECTGLVGFIMHILGAIIEETCTPISGGEGCKVYLLSQSPNRGVVLDVGQVEEVVSTGPMLQEDNIF